MSDYEDEFEQLEREQQSFESQSLVEKAQDIRSRESDLEWRRLSMISSLWPYYESLYRHRHPQVSRVSSFDDEIEYYDDKLIFKHTYNSACHCHPEYVTEQFVLAYDDLKLSPQEFEAKLAGIRAKQAAAQQAKQKADQEKANQEKEQREKAEFERLSAKFGKTTT